MPPARPLIPQSWQSTVPTIVVRISVLLESPSYFLSTCSSPARSKFTYAIYGYRSIWREWQHNDSDYIRHFSTHFPLPPWKSFSDLAASHRDNWVVRKIDGFTRGKRTTEGKRNMWNTRCSRTANRAVCCRRGTGKLGRFHFRGVRHPQGRLADRDHVGVERRTDPARSYGH